MTINLDKAREAVTLLEAWTGGERRDIDAMIAVALGLGRFSMADLMQYIPLNSGMIADGGEYWNEAPHYLGTDPSIATEPMQRVVKEYGFSWERQAMLNFGDANFVAWEHTKHSYRKSASSLPLAFFRAVLAREEEK